MNNKVLITGGAGYLGSILCERLLRANYKVMVIDSLVYHQTSLFHLCHSSNFEFIRGDARDEATLRSALKSADIVLPLAAIVGAPACDRDPRAAESVNLNAIKTLMKLRSQQQLVVFPVTNSGYGTKSGEVFCTEESPLEPISLYGRTKVDAEAEVLSGANSISLRLATVFGLSPRMRLDLLVNHFTHAAVTDRYLVIFEKDFKRNFIHIRDVADAFLHAIQNAPKMVGRAFNAGLDSANISKAELAQKFRQFVPNFYVHYAEVGEDPDKRNYIVSNQRLREAGFEATRALEDGIRELITGYRMLRPNLTNL